MPKYTEQQIAAILNAGKSPRFCRMETYQKYWDGTIYDDRVPFLDMTSEVPLLERAPCVVYPIVRAATASLTSMSMGLGKFPEILSMTSEDDSTFDARFGLSVEESVILDAGVKKIVDQSRLPAVTMQICETALYTGTAVVIASIDQGKLKVGQIDAKTCTPTFDKTQRDVVNSLEVSYRYIDEYWEDSESAWCKRVMQYRRVIDAKADTTFVPVEVTHEKHFPTPNTPDKDKTVFHGLGFCPVLWYARNITSQEAQSIDGKPIHWGLASQLDALHFAYSQRHRAALYAGDPQLWEAGASPEDTRMPMGRVSFAAQPTADNPQGKAKNNGWVFGSGARGGRMARKKGPGTVWSYESPEAKLGLLTLPGDALKAIDLHAADLRIKITEALGTTFVDPSQLKGAGDISGKTLAFIFALQVATCNAIREDFGRKLLLPLMNMLYRIILSPPAKDGLYLSGVKDLMKVLRKFQAPVQNSGLRWFEPAQKLVWGPYFEASDVDEATRTATAMQTWTAGGITLKTAVEHVRDIFAINNVDQYVEQLQKENAVKAQAEMQQQMALASAKGGATKSKKGLATGKAGSGPFAKIDEPSAQAESATANPVPKRHSPETRGWHKASKLE